MMPVAALIGLHSKNLPPPDELSEWEQRRQKLTELWDWFSGEKLQEKDRQRVMDNGDHPLKYPLKINPALTACQLHNYALWGEVSDTPQAMTQLIIETEEEQIAQDIVRVMAQVDQQNNFRSMQLDMGLAAQALGGIVLKVGWDPASVLLQHGIRYEYIDPRDFHPRWSGTDYWNLTECWIKYTVTEEDAARLGLRIDGKTGLYVERWDRSGVNITIDDVPLPGVEPAHGFGFLPVVYIPHERANGFWGMSLIRDMEGMITEINSRLADLGDSIQMNPHGPVVGGNIQAGHPVKKTVGDLEFYDLGKQPPGGNAPFMNRLSPPAIPDSHRHLVEGLLELLRIGMLTPDIAYGREEGSQRSGQTLYNRMWPMLAHIHAERTLWTTALNLKTEMTLRILAQKNRAGIGKAHLGLLKSQAWAPVVPVDRTQLVTELIERWRENAISLELLVEKFGDAKNREREVETIRQQLEENRAQEPQFPAQEGVV